MDYQQLIVNKFCFPKGTVKMSGRGVEREMSEEKCITLNSFSKNTRVSVICVSKIMNN